MTNLFTTERLAAALTTAAYKPFTDHPLAQGRTTGPKPTDETLVHYTRLNAQRVARAIPKLICLDAQSLTVIGHWGLRPTVLQAMVLAYKANPTKANKEFVADVSRRYCQDKNAISSKLTTYLYHRLGITHLKSPICAVSTTLSTGV